MLRTSIAAHVCSVAEYHSCLEIARRIELDINKWEKLWILVVADLESEMN